MSDETPRRRRHDSRANHQIQVFNPNIAVRAENEHQKQPQNTNNQGPLHPQSTVNFQSIEYGHLAVIGYKERPH
jgi:hypothetical protein